MTPPPHANFGSDDLPACASVRLDTDSARRLLGALGAADRDGLAAGDFEGVALPGYTLVRRLGAGASGEVFLALREGSDRPVSVKVWRQGQRGERAVRAWRELDLLGECNLSVVPRVLDYGTRAGNLFVATDYIDGLNPIARSADMSLREQATLLADIADAVQMLHEHGIIHRDLKPANILVTAAGRVFILDLGLAMLAQRTADTLTLEGQPVGTLGYMSPEQARGERAKVSVRSDVYSLGAIGYHLLCGDTPHPMSDSASQSLLRITMTPPRDPRALSVEVPPALAAALAKAVRAEPRERYASAGEFAADLRRWVRGERVLATPPTVWQRMGAWVARHPKSATGVVCGVMAVVSTSAVFSTLWKLQSKPAFLFFNQGEGDTARLVSVTGNELAVWKAGGKGSLKYTAFVPAKQTAIHRDCVLFVATTHSKEKYPGEVVLLRADDPKGTPVWRVGASLLTMPRVSHDESGELTAAYGAMGFSPSSAFQADVFPALRGEEAVVVFTSQGYFPSCVCVIDMEGVVRYEAWNQGHIGQVTWLAGPRRLVCVGVNNSATWKGLGEEGIGETHPTALFALGVDRGSPTNWIDPTCADGHADWYKAMASPDVDRLLGLHIRGFAGLPAGVGIDLETTFAVSLQRSEFDSVGRKWVFNGDGNEVRVRGVPLVTGRTEDEEPDLEKMEAQWLDWPDFLEEMKKRHPDAPMWVEGKR